MNAPVYLVMKTVHVIAVILFLGNIIIGAFWKAHGDRTSDPRIMAFTMDGIIRADRLFTMPGVTLLLIAGFGGTGVGRINVFGTTWILWSLVMLLISAGAFMGRLVPIQRRLRDVARAGADGGTFDRAAYAGLSTQWMIWGIIATLAPVVAVILMVFKPA